MSSFGQQVAVGVAAAIVAGLVLRNLPSFTDGGATQKKATFAVGDEVVGQWEYAAEGERKTPQSQIVGGLFDLLSESLESRPQGQSYQNNGVGLYV